MKDLTIQESVSFVKALTEKYVDQDEMDDQFKVPKDKAISTEITFVGFGKVSSVQKQLRRLASIDLSGKNISFAGDLTQVLGALDRVTILNLADNYLSWNELIKILVGLPNVREIIITGNALQHTTDIEFPKPLFKKLTSLVMGRVCLTWQSIVEVIPKIWTAIDQLDLWANELSETRVGLPEHLRDCSFVKQVSALAMSQNSFLDLGWFPTTGSLVNLTDLDVSRCHLKFIQVDKNTAASLASLKVLNISYNDIQDWRAVSELNILPNLSCLICNDNPFFLTEKFARSLTVAQIAKIKTLNRESISNTFRRDSEILYVRKLFPEYKAFREGSNSEFQRLNPRYEELIKIYEPPEDLNTKQTSDDKYITVNLSYEGKKVVKKLPCDMRVSNLQMLCKRLFKIRPSNSIEIVCCGANGPEGTISYLLDQEGQTLHFFSVKTNDQLLIKQCSR